MIFLYIISFLGSFSLGYLTARIGFPRIQEEPFNKKILIGYFFGTIIFLPSIIFIFLDFEIIFFLLVIGTFFFISTIMFIVRIYNNKEDETELIEEKTSQYIPKRALAPEEKENEEKNEERKESEINNKENYENFKFQKAKELGAEDKIIKINHSTTGKQENGLFIKESISSKISNKSDNKEQIFKEKEPNVINKLREKTINNISSEKELKEKEMQKLKELAKNKENELKEKKKIIDTQELEELTEIDEEF